MIVPDAKIVAVALLTRRDLEAFGGCLERVFSVEENDEFDALLDRLDRVPAVPVVERGETLDTSAR
ncbi:hypothetical protein LK533_08050 [Sphingomonas sp. PL-96]|uniref:hypothetical protein n=1 Tax=Sphingomonas sp. PL-96 TaxID=2887201 RepID=UPI001E553A98|nr:hypothetical protein [Sphingomonas sp. PL-96]MCC2976626.1 hypothetical protein [Sphingomonas sp. PL-96]